MPGWPFDKAFLFEPFVSAAVGIRSFARLNSRLDGAERSLKKHY